MTSQPRSVLITGGHGQLGRALAAGYASSATVAALGRAELDVTDRESVERAVERSAPDLIIHAAAATDVDGCEGDIEGCYRINALGARLMALAAGERDIPIVYVSSNYVFDGRKPAGEAYHEWDAVAPLSVYGLAKLAGEEETRPPRATPSDRPHGPGLRGAGA